MFNPLRTRPLVGGSCRLLRKVLTCSDLVVWGLLAVCALPCYSVLFDSPFIMEMEIPYSLECLIRKIGFISLPE